MAVFNFEYYLSKGLVKKMRKNLSLARSMMESAEDRFEFASSILEEKPRYALENAYEAVIEAIDSLLALNGFKSWSHEADIAFLRDFGFNESEIRRLDTSRNKRHASKYYGVEFSVQEAKEEVKFLDRVFKKIIKIVKSELKLNG